MDFGSFENTIDKNIETDKASDKFDQQLQAYKDAGNSLTLAKGGIEMATASMHEAKDKLSEASDKANTVTKAIEAYIGKVKDITVKAKVDDAEYVVSNGRLYAWLYLLLPSILSEPLLQL